MSDIEPDPRPASAAPDSPSSAPAMPPPPPVEAYAEPPSPPPPPSRQRRGVVMPVFVVLLFLLLAAAVGWLWQQQRMLADRLDAVAPDRVAALESRTQELTQQVAALQQRPAPPPAPAPVDLAPLEQRLAALEQRQPPPPPDVGPLVQKLDSVAADAASAKGMESEMAGRLADLTKRLDTAEQQAGKSADRAAQAQTIARAQVALDAGMPLGDLPGAPPPLARFAQSAPPTEAALRLSFPAAADAAERASRPGMAGKNLGERMWLRARSLVTVKQGDTVLLGAPAAEVLGHAQAKLDAGDLAGAVKTLDGLDGPAADAMAAWRGQAQALLDARAALAQMARG